MKSIQDELRMCALDTSVTREYTRSVCGSAAAEIERLLAAQDAAIRILSDDRMPLQSRVNDARAILARAGHQQNISVAGETK